MKHSSKLLALGLSIAALPALAEVTCGSYTSQPAPGGAQTEVGGASVVVFHNTTKVNSDSSGRFTGLSGHCGGTVTVMPDGSMHVVGNCTVADAGGDIALYHFIHKRGEERGRFMRAGGTGKFAKEFQEGWYQQTGQDDNGATGLWGGSSASVCK